jgi:hypothetical protein
MKLQYHFLIALCLCILIGFLLFVMAVCVRACEFVFDNSQQLAYVFCLMVHISAA